MNKEKLIVTAILGSFLLIAVFLNLPDKNKLQNTIREDSIQFKEEYENLNDKTAENGEKLYVDISIDQDNPIKYSEFEEIEELITSGTGVIYFGFPECPWCRNAIPILFESAKEAGIDTIYYFNAYSIRDKKHLDENGNVIVDDEGTSEYKKLVELLYDYLDVYDGLKDDSIKRLYFPTVIFIKDGEVIGSHTGTVSTQTDPIKPLNKSEKGKLKDIYLEYMHQISGSMCSVDGDTKC